MTSRLPLIVTPSGPSVDAQAASVAARRNLRTPFDNAVTAAILPLLLQFRILSATFTCRAMAPGFAVTLPYGLSEMHRQHHIKGKVVIGREGEYTRGCLPISTHLSETAIVLPIITYHRAIDAPRPSPT